PPRVTPLFCVGLDQAGVLCNATFRNPYLSRRTAPAHVDESDGNVKFLVQAASEIISHSTKACNALRSRNLPRPLSHRLRVVGPCLGNVEQPNSRNVRGGNIFATVSGCGHAPFHIRLAGTNPDLTYHDVVQCKL